MVFALRKKKRSAATAHQHQHLPSVCSSNADEEEVMSTVSCRGDGRSTPGVVSSGNFQEGANLNKSHRSTLSDDHFQLVARDRSRSPASVRLEQSYQATKSVSTDSGALWRRRVLARKSTRNEHPSGVRLLQEQPIRSSSHRFLLYDEYDNNYDDDPTMATAPRKISFDQVHDNTYSANL